ncbi:hydrogen gas-evolving membrane-bound hydrogenase subunit E [Pseudonocardia oroxyli]|uniref:Multisubunit sodium/proton antiporter, MrpA subunit n=1 Tax=Pseudonocardia oroxyli TaxID=366584 RepID=A0A1G7KML5_PSEOR|nr:hydrogen gas-evolving membrane-bound hydrogenase subunit E [Pseudonocardia oroxyli]SDF38180.1 multisubunit sodium/proton antiporter, MrpA subunit [Pseudonocardia oroxyli]
MLALVVAHLVVAALLPLVSRRSRRAAFGVAAVLPAATLVWGLANLPAVLGPGPAPSETHVWASALHLEFGFRLDALGVVMIVLVGGLGALILAYSAWYFGKDSRDAPRNSALLLAFAGAMLGLVLADDLLTLYLFWELTSIASFLLVGQGGLHRANRRAAVQALLVTVMGGLAMLLGIVIVGESAGTYRISEIVAAAQQGAGPAGGLAATGIVLILIGALTKSAQFPFHPWLPGAMAAPTPVSAYLHAASMVKAGVVLVGRLSPAFADRSYWWVPIAVLGLVTMLVGGWRALHETDLKRLLAFGTVSQLGFLMVLFGSGDRIGEIAALTMLLAHGLFKAPLFMVVGIVDKVTGTREVGALSGLGRRLPGLAAAATLAAASMAGIPFLLGFLGKEAAFEAFVHDGDWVLALGLLLGSIFTVAYSARFLWGAFATKAGVEATEPRPVVPGLSVPTWIAAFTGLVLGCVPPLTDALARNYAAAYPAEDAVAADYHLALWHGLSLPLLFSAVALIVGATLHLQRARVTGLHTALRHPLSAQRGYEVTVGGIERFAVWVTGRIQAGSLPVYLGVLLLTVLVLPGLALVFGGTLPATVPGYGSLMQLPLGLVIVACAAALTRVRRRFTAVLLVGAIGYAIGGLFVVDGGPDLALAQFLVETLTMVAFVFVLRRLPAHFDAGPRVGRGIQLRKAALATVAGVFVAVAAVVLSGARQEPPAVSGEFVARAPEAGADNVIAAILVDFRALDTVGEITVLLIAAAGTASLVLATRHDKKGKSGRVESGGGTPEHEEEIAG